MGKTVDLLEFEHQANLNWALAQRAESEGNYELAHELAAMAREADVLAHPTRRLDEPQPWN